MKAVMLMFDSLNRHMLSAYGGQGVHTPNFSRLAERTATFDCSYVGSMPCMPARRELHTGRYNFLHRSWGPLEPYDDSMPELLVRHGVHTHLVSDHYHYWEEGGCNYHTRYGTWQAVRGQEGDPWKAHLPSNVPMPETLNLKYRPGMPARIRQDFVNRHYQQREEQMCQPQTMAGGIEFLRTNAAADNWFLHIETFDPHEPYFAARRFVEMYPSKFAGHFDWPPYDRMDAEDPAAREHCRLMNAALHTMCDFYLGRVLDAFDELGLWKDTLLIVNTDHGFLLGEHDFWGKCWCPFYEEIAHTPLFVWDPRSGVAGQRRGSLVQTIDLAPTVLEYFGLDRPADMQGAALRQTVADDRPVREAGLFGLFGGHVNVTDGRYVYMRAPVDAAAPLFEYTHMPTHMRQSFSVEEMRRLEGLAGPFAFTKGCKVMKIPGRGWRGGAAFQTMLFDLQADPHQQRPIRDAGVEARMTELLVGLMQANDAPPEQYQRLGLAPTAR